MGMAFATSSKSQDAWMKRPSTSTLTPPKTTAHAWCLSEVVSSRLHAITTPTPIITTEAAISTVCMEPLKWVAITRWHATMALRTSLASSSTRRAKRASQVDACWRPPAISTATRCTATGLATLFRALSRAAPSSRRAISTQLRTPTTGLATLTHACWWCLAAPTHWPATTRTWPMRTTAHVNLCRA